MVKKLFNILLSTIAVIIIIICVVPIIIWFKAYKGDPLNGD
jgi:lipopolysaccharide/colanic/teichoic acid biosynthesis glycosyltransferase